MELMEKIEPRPQRIGGSEFRFRSTKMNLSIALAWRSVWPQQGERWCENKYLPCTCDSLAQPAALYMLEIMSDLELKISFWTHPLRLSKRNYNMLTWSDSKLPQRIDTPRTDCSSAWARSAVIFLVSSQVWKHSSKDSDSFDFGQRVRPPSSAFGDAFTAWLWRWDEVQVGMTCLAT